MATITGLTAGRMQEIIDKTVTDADIIANHLILTLEDGSTIDAGAVGPAGKGAAFPSGATDGDLFVRTDQAGDPLYKFTDGAWQPFTGGGVTKATSFPTVPAPTDGDLVVRTDQAGDPLYKFTDGVWELQPRMGAQNVPAVRATSTGADLSIPAPTTDVAVSFNAEDHDTDSMHDVATNNTRLTVKTPGLYLLEGTVRWGGSPDAWRRLMIRKNGSTSIAEDFIGVSTGTNPESQTVKAIVRLAAGDYIELCAAIAYTGAGTGPSLNIVRTGPFPNFTATWLGGAGQTVDERGVPAVKATLLGGGTQTINVGTTAVVAFPAEDFDTDGMHDTSSNTSRLTIKTPGLYDIRGAIQLGSNATGDVSIQLFKNGAAVPDPNAFGPYAYLKDRLVVSAQLMLAAGDYIEIAVTVSTGSNAVMWRGYLSAVMDGAAKTVTPFARVYATSGQSVPLGGTALVAFANEDADNDNIHDNVTNNTRLTCRTAGVYLVHGLVCCSAASATGGTRWLDIYKNGSTIAATINDANDHVTVRDTVVQITTLVELAVGDYLELAIQNIESSGAMTLVGGSGTRGTKFAMVKIGAPLSGNTGIDPIENWHTVGAAGEPVLTNAWVNNSGGEALAGFYKDRSRVYLRGLVNGGASGSSVFTLPVGYRPLSPIRRPVVLNNATLTFVIIGTDGTVKPQSAGSISLESIDFSLT